MEDTRDKSAEWIDNQLWLYDTLHPSFRNWLEFYDTVPAEYHNTNNVEYSRIYDASVIMKFFGVDPAQRGPQVTVVHSVRKEYLLARVAELLLPARMSLFELDGLRRRVDTQRDPVLVYQEIGEILSPLAAVARPK